MIAIGQRVIEGFERPRLHVDAKAMHQIARVTRRHPGFLHHPRQRLIRCAGGGVAGQGALRLPMHLGQPFRRGSPVIVAAFAQNLAIDHIIGVPAPGIKQHGPVPRGRIKQPRRQRKAFGTPRNRGAGIGKNV